MQSPPRHVAGEAGDAREATAAQRRAGQIRPGAMTAIDDDRIVWSGAELARTPQDGPERDVDRSGNVATVVFGTRPHVEYRLAASGWRSGRAARADPRPPSAPARLEYLDERPPLQLLLRQARLASFVHRQRTGAQPAHEEVEQPLSRRGIVEHIADERRLSRLSRRNCGAAPSRPGAPRGRRRRPRHSASAAAPDADPIPGRTRSRANAAHRRSAASTRDGRRRGSRGAGRL